MFEVSFPGQNDVVTFAKLAHMKTFMNQNDLCEDDILKMTYLLDEKNIRNLWTPPKPKRVKRTKDEKIQKLLDKKNIYELRIVAINLEIDALRNRK